MAQRWESLSFLHWRVDPDQLQRTLPEGLSVQTFDNEAWLGLVPFHMRVGFARGPLVPWIGSFCETNVRTYVTDTLGRPGIWFYSLDAARLAAVVTARLTYRLPYYWAQMTVTESDSQIRYRSRRRWPHDASITSNVQLGIGDSYLPNELTALDHFLTARWRLFSSRKTGLRSARAEHAPWPLRRARLVDISDELVPSVGPRLLDTEPLVHYSPGVDVRVGPPERQG